MSPTVGSVATIWPVIEELIEQLSGNPDFEGVLVDVTHPASDARPKEMLTFGEIQDSEFRHDHLSGGQRRVAKTEELEITGLVVVSSGKRLKDSARRAWEIATFVEDHLAADSRLAAGVPALSWLTIARVSGEPTESTRAPEYQVTITLTGQSRLRG